MRKLLLTSQGLPPGIKETFLDMLTKPPEDASVAFITTAAYGESTDVSWLEIYRKQLRSCGISKIEDIDIGAKSKNELKSSLSHHDVLFVNGGNTFYLLKNAKESGFDMLVPQLLDAGMIYVGISAGSYIACPTIEQSYWKQKFKDRKTYGLKDVSALHLVPFLLTAHFEEKYRTTIQENSKSTKYPVVALSDSQAVFVNGHSYSLIGEGSREFYNGFVEVK